jgi:hypothetical protein
MSRLRFLVPSRAMAVAILALGFSMTGTALAVNPSLLLDQGNSATGPTTVTADSTWPTSSSQRLLQLTNANSATGATALGLNVASGHPPFTVNSTKKVANLNADLLDGKDSSAFTSGTGSNRFASANVDADHTFIVALELGSRAFILSYSCPTDPASQHGLWRLEENFSSTTSFEFTAQTDTAVAHGTLTPGQAAAPLADGNDPHFSAFQLFWPGHKLVTILAASSHSATTCDEHGQVLTAGS